MLYAMEEEGRDDPAAHDINSEAFWEKLSSIFKQTHEMIATMAAEPGIDLESIDLEPARVENDRPREESEIDWDGALHKRMEQAQRASAGKIRQHLAYDGLSRVTTPRD